MVQSQSSNSILVNRAIYLGLFMAIIDVVTLPLIKKIYTDDLPKEYMIIPILIYSMQPIIFYNAMKYANVTTMNIIWDLTSDILVTLVGVFLLRETLTNNSKLGLLFGFIAIYFFAKDNSGTI